MNQSQFQKAAGLSAGLAARWFARIDAAMKEFGITAPLDQALFIAQMGHESGGYTRLVESLNYTAENLVPNFGSHRHTPDWLSPSDLPVVLPFCRVRRPAGW